MQRHAQYTRDRVAQLIDRLQSKVHRQTLDVEQLLISPPVGRITCEQAGELDYQPVQRGRQLGPPWTTFWFRGRVDVPHVWIGHRVDLIWNSHSEATLWMDGQSVGGVNPGRSEVPLMKAVGRETIEFQVEVACNTLFGLEDRPYETIDPYVFEQCAMGLFDPEAWDLYHDLHVLCELEKAEGIDRDWSGKLLYELNRIANVLDEEDRSTWPEAKKIAAALYDNHNGDYRHEISAIGHAHIDTAWLWPLAETWRKCTRSFSTAVLYMDSYPEYKFACSQAVQYAEMKNRNPALYRRIREKVTSGQWIPVGGTWVEPDCNIPSGESLCRQFLYGQRFFQKEFGITCREFWDPDVFGYNGQLPQIMRQAGIEHFLTQKLSWNRFNKPEHQTFTWQGIDGSEVLTHFPPADTYNAEATVEQLRRCVSDYRDNDRSGHSIMLFGIGDGGGGPTRAMLERIRRAKDLQGLPRTTIRTSAAFFQRLKADCEDLPLVIGELYFEYHRGTYTTQAATKRGNRKGEILLHDLEFVAAVNTLVRGAAYPKDDLDRLWKRLLLNQFHDILPGSSITEVYEDTARDHEAIQTQANDLRTAALTDLGGEQGPSVPVNTTGFARGEVAERPDGRLVFVEVPSYGIGQITHPPDSVRLDVEDDRIELENGHLKAVLGVNGSLLNLVEKSSGRQALDAAGNTFLIYEDKPTAWEAWDIDPFALETARPCPPASSWEAVEKSALRGEVRFTRKVGKASTLWQTVRLDAGARRLEFHTEVEWAESRRMLKVAFPVQVRAFNATYEMQFGHVERPTHYNTSYDLARFEVPGHKWVDLSEHGFGVALLSDCKYGYHTFGNTMHMTLLRASKMPDSTADMGTHRFAYAIYPHLGTWQEAAVVAEGFTFNLPLLWTGSAAAPASYFSVDDANLVLDTVKKSEDSDGLVLRLYEAHGARGVARLKVDIPFTSARRCNILEEEGEALEIADGNVVIPYGPHQLISLVLR